MSNTCHGVRSSVKALVLQQRAGLFASPASRTLRGLQSGGRNPGSREGGRRGGDRCARDPARCFLPTGISIWGPREIRLQIHFETLKIKWHWEQLIMCFLKSL